jgi:hypothetical protein
MGEEEISRTEHWTVCLVNVDACVGALGMEWNLRSMLVHSMNIVFQGKSFVTPRFSSLPSRVRSMLGDVSSFVHAMFCFNTTERQRWRGR